MKIVFNSSPLIFLARLDFLEKFLESLDAFYLPKSVTDEIEAKQDQPSSYIRTLIDSRHIEVREVSLVSLANSLNERLGKGESEAIAPSHEPEATDNFPAQQFSQKDFQLIENIIKWIEEMISESLAIRVEL